MASWVAKAETDMVEAKIVKTRNYVPATQKTMSFLLLRRNPGRRSQANQVDSVASTIAGLNVEFNAPWPVEGSRHHGA